MVKLHKIFGIILSKLQLLFSSYNPSDLYIGLFIIFIFLCLLVVAFGFLSYFYTKNKNFNIISIPSFISLLPLPFSILAIATGKINIIVVLASLIINFFLTYILLYFQEKNDNFEDSKLLLNISSTNKKSYVIFYLTLIFLPIFFIISIAHNYLPPQFDITTYQFLGDIFFRKELYPTLPFAGNHTLTSLASPGYFIYDFIMRLFWNNPRFPMLISAIFLLSAGIAFVRLGSLLFKDKKIEIFILLAVFIRGIFWNSWEGNVLRALSVVCSIMFVNTLLQYYQTKDYKKSLIYLLFAQLFFASALLTHPEHSFYILAGVFMLVGCIFIIHIFQKQKELIKKGISFFVSLIIPFSLFLVWYLLIINPNLNGSFFFTKIMLPVPYLSKLLFHFNGIIPVIATIFGIFLLVINKDKEKKNIGLIFLFIFMSAIFLSYFQFILHLILPKTFTLIDGGRIDDFTGARYFVQSFIVNPNSVIAKMTSFWWFCIIGLGWVLYFIWNKLKLKKLQIFFLILVISLMFFDISLMYYNQPIITKNEYIFLKNLENKIPKESVMIAPPGYYFSVWVGPVLHRDSISNRAASHSVNSISKNIDQEIQDAYSSENFELLLNKLQKNNVVILFNNQYSNLAKKLLSSSNWILIYKQDQNYALKYKG